MMSYYLYSILKDRDVDVRVTVFPPPLILVEKSFVKLRASEAAILW